MLAPVEKQHLLSNTTFLSPRIIEALGKSTEVPIILPLTFRGRKQPFDAEHYSGYPVFVNDRWFALWNMRPARDVASIALGLKRRDLERNACRSITCQNGTEIKREWTVHHVYECGLSELSVPDRAARFTNIANLVLIDRKYHTEKNEFLHGDSDGALFLRGMIHRLYEEVARPLGTPPEKSTVSLPDLSEINISVAEGREIVERLLVLRETEPAGSPTATARIRDAERGEFIPRPTPSPKRRPITPMKRTPPRSAHTAKPMEYVPTELVRELKPMGYHARQNSNKRPTFFVNLGGAQSEVNRPDFKGLLFFSPVMGIAFGACPWEVRQFRDRLMQQINDEQWVRKPGVPGPKEKNRVEVWFEMLDREEPGIVCKCDDEDDLRLDGYADELRPKGGWYSWTEVRRFLTKFEEFCRQTKEDDNE